MASIPQTAPSNDLNGKAGAPGDAPVNAKPDAQTATEKESDSFLDRETAGQVFDDNSGQQMADMMDDSLRSDTQAPEGPSPATDENLPDELMHARDANFTLPEMQHQGKNLTAESDPED
jgi:hypothetical protein